MDVLLAYMCTMYMPGLRGSGCPCGKLSTEPGSFTQTSAPVPSVVQHWEGREGEGQQRPARAV